MFKIRKYKTILSMMTNINEKCLLKYLGTKDGLSYPQQDEFTNLLNKLNIKILSPEKYSLYDIIEEYENN